MKFQKGISLQTPLASIVGKLAEADSNWHGMTELVSPYTTSHPDFGTNFQHKTLVYETKAHHKKHSGLYLNIVSHSMYVTNLFSAREFHIVLK